MKIAALYDIHGNAPALRAALVEVLAQDVDQIVIGGDVLPGPLAGECLSLLSDLSVPVDALYGNGERAVLAASEAKDLGALPEAVQAQIRWNADQLNRSHLQWLRSWPATRTYDVPGLGTVLFCHATPRNEQEIFTERTPDDTLKDVFMGVDADIVVCGHTHMPVDRMVGALRLVTSGSVGMPFDRPGAHWLLLDSDGGVAFHCASYDPQEASERIEHSDWPGAEAFARDNVLSVPGRETMLEALAPAELRG